MEGEGKEGKKWKGNNLLDEASQLD
jgi:hypothetical protein